MRLARRASVTAAAAAAAAAAAGPAAVTPTVITSVPMLPGVAAGNGADTAEDGGPGPEPGSGWRPDRRPGRPGAPRVWLKLSLSGPMFGDGYNEMYYALGLANSRLSPDSATGWWCG